MSTIVDSVASQCPWNANLRFCTAEFLAVGSIFEFSPNGFKTLGTNSLVSEKEPTREKKTKFAVVKANFLFRDKTKAKLLKLGPKTKLGTLPSQNFFDLLVEKQEKLEIQKKVNKVATKVLWGLGSWLIYMHHHSG